MSQLVLFGKEEKKLVNLKEASQWASDYLNRKVTISNISYLIQYGRIKKYGNSGNPLISIEEISIEELKVAEEFWDFLGGDGTYSEILDCFERAGIELRPEIDSYFSKFK